MPSRLHPRLLLVSAAHLTIDAYSSFVTPLIPLLIVKLHLSLTQVGTLVALSSLASSLSQPLFGWLSDRLSRPWFVAFGPLVAAVFLSSVGLAPSFGGLAAIVMLGGIGAAAFHPQAAVLASGLSERRALAMSTFVTGGTIGFSIGPLFAAAMAGALGLERTWLGALPGLVVSAVLIAWFARVPPAARFHRERPAFSELRPVWRPLAMLYFAVVFRSAVSFGFMTFLPILLHRRGLSVQSGGVALSAYLGAGAVGGLLGGWIAERWGGRGVVIRSFLGALPLFVAFLLLPTGPGVVCLALGNLMLQGSLPVNVVIGQELSPRHASTISSLLMGFAWGLGVLMVGPTGALADARGLENALLALTTLLGAGLLCAIALPKMGPAAAGTAAVEAAVVAEP